LPAKFKRIASVILFALIGVAILWYITRGQDVNRIWNEFLEANFIWVLLSMLSGAVSHVLRALRWNLLITSMNHTSRTSTTFYALMTGYLANLAVPRLGEVTRCATLSKYSGVPFNVLAGTVVAERVFDMICLLALIFFTIVFQFQFLKEFLDYYVFSPLMNMTEGKIWIILLLGFVGLGLLFLMWKYFKNVSSQKQSLASKIKRQLMGFLKGMASLGLVKKKVLFLVYSFLIWVLYFMMVYLVFFAINATSHLGLMAGLTLLVMGSLGIVAPVPGGVGTYHFIVIITLTELYGIASEPATSYAYLAHASQMLMVILLGAFSWMMLSIKVKEFVKQKAEPSVQSIKN
jgi:glycosyltransferase 2 family protein